MATVFRLLVSMEDGARQIGYDYDDVTMQVLTEPYAAGAVVRSTVIRFNLGDDEETVTRTTRTKTNIATGRRPTATLTSGGKVSGPFVAVSG